MAFTAENMTESDLRRHSYVNVGGTGSQTSLSVTVASGNITIGSVSAFVESVYVQSGNIQPISADTVFGVSGNNLPVTQNTSPWVISGTATIGSQANLYAVLCALESGTTDIVPLKCVGGILLFSGAS